jgi:cytochrome c-type biogenesis protein CcmH
MVAFWVIAGGMTLAAVGFVAVRLVFPRGAPAHAEPREATLAALQASWAELERDRAAGLLPADQQEAARAELVRRAQEELDEAPASPVRGRSLAAAAAVAVLIPFAALALYRQVGSPEAIDTVQAFAGLDGPITPGRLPAFRDSLARHLADNPQDGRAWAILGRIELGLDRYEAAAAAFARATESSRKVAADPEIWVDYAEAAGMAEGRTLVGRPARFIARALEIDPANPRALEMAGSLAMERGDAAAAARHWRALQDRLEPGDPRQEELARAIARAGRLAMPGGMTQP